MNSDHAREKREPKEQRRPTPNGALRDPLQGTCSRSRVKEQGWQSGLQLVHVVPLCESDTALSKPSGRRGQAGFQSLLAPHGRDCSQPAPLNTASKGLISGLDAPVGLADSDLLCFQEPKFTFITCPLPHLAALITLLGSSLTLESRCWFELLAGVSGSSCPPPNKRTEGPKQRTSQ